MKRKLMLMCTLVVIFSMLLSSLSFAAETPTDYNQLFSQAKASDGAESESIAEFLGNSFNENPQAFIAEASLISDDNHLSKISELLVSYYFSNNYSDFKNRVKEIGNAENLTPDNQRVIDSIIKAMDVIDANQENQIDMDAEFTPNTKVFDPDIVLEFIQGSLVLNPDLAVNTDELFNEYVADKFKSDPYLFVDTISSVTNLEVSTIAKCIAYDCKSKGIHSSDIIPIQKQAKFNAFETNILDTILNEIDYIATDTNTPVVPEESIDTITELNDSILTDKATDIVIASTQVPTIGVMNYISTPLIINETETLRATFQESKSTKTARTYFAEVYIIKGSTSTKAASKSFTIPSGSSSVNVDFTLKFSTAGSYYTLIKVYSSSGGSLLVQRQGSNPDYVYGAPTIGAMTYTTAPLKVNEDETLSVVFSESTSQVKREYLVKIYGVINSTKYLRSTKTVVIPAGSTSVTQTFSFKLPVAGTMYTTVSVYNSAGTTLMNERVGTSPDNITGDWKITVSLPSNRNNKGTLTLYNCSGTSISSFECLGRSVSNGSMTVTNGNTPTGTYTGYLYGPASPTSSYGPYKVVNMTGVSGVIVSSGRSGIWIHGGDAATDTSDTWYPLRPTHGCVRISNSNQSTLQTKIENLINNSYHNKTGNIVIS